MSGKAVQKGLEARRARIEQRSVPLRYVSMREPKRNAAYEPFSTADKDEGKWLKIITKLWELKRAPAPKT